MRRAFVKRVFHWDIFLHEFNLSEHGPLLFESCHYMSKGSLRLTSTVCSLRPGSVFVSHHILLRSDILARLPKKALSLALNGHKEASNTAEDNDRATALRSLSSDASPGIRERGPSPVPLVTDYSSKRDDHALGIHWLYTRYYYHFLASRNSLVNVNANLTADILSVDQLRRKTRRMLFSDTGLILMNEKLMTISGQLIVYISTTKSTAVM
jgi:hypothetical protein